MNKGMAMASGKYLIFLNSGDELASKDILEDVASIARASNWPDMIYGDAYERTKDGSLLYKRARSKRWLWYGMFTHHQAIFYNNGIVGSLKYRLKYPIGADYAFTAEVLANSKNVLQLPFAVCIFTQGGLSENCVSKGAKEQWEIRRDIISMSLPSMLFVRICHLLMHGIKKFLPGFYRKIRFS
jgi:putative colanic acid biosynthesis glycosyltransferase